MTEEELPRLRKLHELVIGIYWDINVAIENYLSVGCDIGHKQGVEPGSHFRSLSQKLNDEMMFLHYINNSERLLETLHNASDRILEAPQSGLKTYQSARMAVYKAHTEIESNIGRLYLFERFIQELTFHLYVTDTIRLGGTEPNEQIDLESISYIRDKAIDIIEKYIKMLFFEHLAGSDKVSTSIYLALRRIKTITIDEKASKKIVRSIEIIIDDAKQFLNKQFDFFAETHGSDKTTVDWGTIEGKEAIIDFILSYGRENRCALSDAIREAIDTYNIENLNSKNPEQAIRTEISRFKHK